MHQRLPDHGATPLLAIGEPATAAGGVRTRAVRAVSAAICEPPGRCVWIQGPDGVGKTTATTLALSELDGIAGAVRIRCHAGLRLEEVLEDLADFLRQLGSTELARVLGQRCSLEAKIAVLLRTIESAPVVIWLDDVDRLAVGRAENRSAVLHALVSDLAAVCVRGAGRVIITSRGAPPVGAPVRWIDLPRLDDQDRERLWEAFAADQSLPSTDEPPSWTTPFALRVARHLGSAGGPAEPDAPGVEIDWAHQAALEGLSDESREILVAFTAFGRPLRRGSARAMASAVGSEVLLSALDEDPRLAELRRVGLLEVHLDRDGRPLVLQVHPVCQTRLSRALPEHARDLWNRLLECAAAYHLRSIAKTGRGLWTLYAAREAYFEAERHEEASQIHKCFLEDLLRLGYFDVARCVLSQTIETTSGTTRAVSLGNLAILHKNSGEYDRALELYEQVRDELWALGDRANVARVLHQIGNVHYLREEFDAAIDCYRESAQLSEELEETTISAATRVQIANVLYQTGRAEEALAVYSEIVEELQRERPDQQPGIVAAVRIQMGQIHQRAKRWVEAELHLRDAEESVRATDDRRSLIKVLRARAILSREQREYEHAVELYTEAFEVSVGLGDIGEAATCRVLEGDLERDRMQLGRALDRYLAARSLLESPEATRVTGAERLDASAQLIDSRLGELRDTMGQESFERAVRARGAAGEAPDSPTPEV